MRSPNGCPLRDFVYQFKYMQVPDFFLCPHSSLFMDLLCQSHCVPVTPSQVRALVLSKAPKHHFF